MNNELVKELKDNGFPLIEFAKPYARYSYQDEKHFCLICGLPLIKIEHRFYARPFLEELIKECDDLKFLLIHDKDGWYAENEASMSPSNCKTPEEAIALLWLSVHRCICKNIAPNFVHYKDCPSIL